MTLVTVTYHAEKEMMRLQADSLELFLDKPCTHIVIIQDRVMTRHEWWSYLKPHYKKHRLKLYSIEEICRLNDDMGGWYQQQLAKIYVSWSVDTDSYLILDSKNFFIKPTDLDQWSVQEGNGFPALPEIPWKQVLDIPFNEMIEDFCRLIEFNTQLPRPEFFLRPHPPFKINTAHARSMSDYDLIPLFTYEGVLPSEFILYQYFNKDTCKDDRRMCENFFTPEQVVDRMDLARIALHDQTRMLGIHQRSISPQLSEKKLVDWLIARGFEKNVVEFLDMWHIYNNKVDTETK
jgi:hypothetical protein